MYRGVYEAKRVTKRTGKGAAKAAGGAAQPKKKRGPKTHTVVFYSIYTVCILAFFVGVFFLMGELDQFLVKYEASQPDVKSQEVFDQLFSDPDWGRIYDLAKAESGVYEGRSAFVTYMENKVGQERLSLVETSMGLSQDKKFYVRLGEENVASFSLTNTAGTVAIPQWELKEVGVYYTLDASVTIQSYPGYTVSVNGVPLGEEQIIRTTQTNAEQYLPEGLYGVRTVTYYLDGLMAAPTVTVTDPNGAEVALRYDETACAYFHEVTPGDPVTDQQKTAFRTASEAYGKFMIAALSKNNLAKYFAGNSYKAIIQAELAWMQSFSSYKFGELELTEFVAYSDSFCSGRVHQILYVTRSNGTVKEYEINSTFFMEKQQKGWMVVEMTNADVQAAKSQVRLTFMQDGTQLDRVMVDAEGGTLTTPAVTVPEGKVFSGWFRQSVNEAGKTVYSQVFQPDENGQVRVPVGYTLEPMVLYALFENEVAE